MADDSRPSGWIEFDEIRIASPDEKREPSNGSAAKSAEADDQPAVISPRVETVMDPAQLGKKNPMERRNGMEKEEGAFKNGKVVVSVWPENTTCAWVIPPRYNPYSMPAILASQGIKMLPDDYILALEMITNDYRFRSYCTLYGRLVAIWMTLSLLVLLAVLFSSPQGGLPVLIFCFGWCATVLIGILGCCVLRKQMRVGLRHAVQAANRILQRHGILAGVEDRGQISCHKVVIHLMYFDTTGCQSDLERLVRIKSTGGALLSPDQPTPPSLVNEEASKLLLKYSHGYVKESVTSRLVFPTRPTQGVSEYSPKHCEKNLCLCQYIEKRHFNRKPKKWYEHVV
ncbi:hypothetical protein PMAYCL1PPCAC_03683 [Pristionchus mayeri]|uniref:Transmembrane protein n=1 Tax=Pristionchus mayeri TaxID=1317129 RepID=A0AAN4Z3H5_9BILA|nr:hypothetical protein PMAYCL1PPCAC_03683 [Pristionchus mayeri]